VVSPVVSAGRGKGTGAAASAADARVGVQVGSYCAFADVSAVAPAIASADTARRSRFITASFFHAKCQRPSAKSSSGYYRNLRFPELCGNRCPADMVSSFVTTKPPLFTIVRIVCSVAVTIKLPALDASHNPSPHRHCTQTRIRSERQRVCDRHAACR